MFARLVPTNPFWLESAATSTCFHRFIILDESDITGLENLKNNIKLKKDETNDKPVQTYSAHIYTFKNVMRRIKNRIESIPGKDLI